MGTVSGWRARSSEFEQSLLRVLIAGVVVFYISWSLGRHASSWTESDKIVVWSLVAWLLVALGFLVAAWIWPAPNISRRALGIVLDVATITGALYFLDARGSAIVFVYLFIIFGNGFRYGRGYLFFSQGVSLLGLLLLATNASWWKSHLDVSLGWANALLVLPLYVGVLAERLKAARAKAEEALRDCIERQPRLS
jgi:two-component system, sensor histidine kinase RpfC